MNCSEIWEDLHENLGDRNFSGISFMSQPGVYFTSCLMNGTSSTVFASYCITNILLLLPLCVFIIHLGLQRRRQQQRSAATATTTTTSHSDVFTYHLVAMELFGVSGFVLCCFGIYSRRKCLVFMGYLFESFTEYGQLYFHVLTCLERYLAVVYPTTYMTLRGDRGVRVRNISVVSVWLLCFMGVSVITFPNFFLSQAFCVLSLSLIVTTFCSISVLCVLIRPGPGERGGARDRVDQSKQRAFYTIAAVLVVLFFRFTWNLVCAYLYMVIGPAACLALTSGFWCNLPSRLVLPLLFLNRAEKLVCCKYNRLGQSSSQTFNANTRNSVQFE